MTLTHLEKMAFKNHTDERLTVEKATDKLYEQNNSEELEQRKEVLKINKPNRW